jgi:acyl-CoA thioesterase FadM
MPRDPAIGTAYPFFRSFTTRWRDNDVYGHLNNAVYYEDVDTIVNGWLVDHDGLPRASPFPATSRRTALSSMASARSRFSRPFSSSNAFSRWASETSSPPNLAFHL